VFLREEGREIGRSRDPVRERDDASLCPLHAYLDVTAGAGA
jgi:hypothetical protein